MANKQRGELTIILNNKTYTMRPTFEAMCEMEERLNSAMPELIMRLQSGDLKFRTIATIVWCGIHGYLDDGFGVDASPTLNEIGNAIRQHGITKLLSEGITEGLNPIVNFMTRGLVGDEEADKATKGKPETETEAEKPTPNQ